MMSKQNVIETLSRARDLILKHGWVKGYDGNTERGFCLIGAVVRSIKCDHGTDIANTYLYRQIRALLQDAIDRPEASVSVWNDQPQRTLGEVLAAIDHAIALAKAQNVAARPNPAPERRR
jgi:hypothetical protein